MNSKHYSTVTEAQQQRLIEQLRLCPMTTLQARSELDIMHPAARVKELRERGHNIVTHWTVEHTGKGRHRVARYVLLAGA